MVLPLILKFFQWIWEYFFPKPAEESDPKQTNLSQVGDAKQTAKEGAVEDKQTTGSSGDDDPVIVKKAAPEATCRTS